MTPADAQAALKLAPLDLEQFDDLLGATLVSDAIHIGEDYALHEIFVSPEDGGRLLLGCTIAKNGAAYAWCVTDFLRLILAAPRLLAELRRTREERDAYITELREVVRQRELRSALKALVAATAFVEDGLPRHGACIDDDAMKCVACGVESNIDHERRKAQAVLQ